MRGQGLQLLKNAFEKSMQMCDKTQPLVTRISGAYLLGKIVKHFTPNYLPIGWAAKVSLMVQDFNYEGVGKVLRPHHLCEYGHPLLDQNHN